MGEIERERERERPNGQHYIDKEKPRLRDGGGHGGDAVRCGNGGASGGGVVALSLIFLCFKLSLSLFFHLGLSENVVLDFGFTVEQIVGKVWYRGMGSKPLETIQLRQGQQVV